MTSGVHWPPPETLPDTLAVFPLSGAFLLPRARLPLNIFESRYLNLTEDALASDCMMGMVQPRETGAETFGNTAPIYDVGCAGRITSFSETDDGRYLIELTGLCRFRVRGELEMVDGYRRVEPDFKPYLGDLADDDGETADRDRLLAEVRPFFEGRGMAADWSALAQLPDDALVTALAMVAPFGTPEKQALLECVGLAERCRLLVSLIEIATHELEAGTAPSCH